MPATQNMLGKYLLDTFGQQMTLVEKLNLLLVWLERFRYLGVCLTHKINRSFNNHKINYENSCELVREKIWFWTQWHSYGVDQWLQKHRPRTLCGVGVITGVDIAEFPPSKISHHGCISKDTRKSLGINVCVYEDRDRMCYVPLYTVKYSTDNSLV